MAALSHIYPLFWLLHTEPSSPTPLGLVATSPPTHSDTCQQEDMTVMFLKGALCMNYCSFLVCCTGSKQGFQVWFGKLENERRAVYCLPRTKDCSASIDVGELHNVFSAQTIKQLKTDGAICK